MIIFCDIDGTLTDAPFTKWGNPKLDIIDKLKRLIAEGKQVVIWSGGGTEYAEQFAKKYEIKAIACIGKPGVMVDDNDKMTNPGIRRPITRTILLTPQQFLVNDL